MLRGLFGIRIVSVRPISLVASVSKEVLLFRDLVQSLRLTLVFYACVLYWCLFVDCKDNSLGKGVLYCINIIYLNSINRVEVVFVGVELLSKDTK